MDHYPPPLVLLWRILHSMHAWLKLDERNVCAVHCLAGKGRTGTIIASFFVFCGLFDNIRVRLCRYCLPVVESHRMAYMWAGCLEFLCLPAVTQLLGCDGTVATAIL